MAFSLLGGGQEYPFGSGFESVREKVSPFFSRDELEASGIYCHQKK
jgi:hypothetical protein